MADLGALTFAGGLAMGAASSLHCASMCGGVGAAMMFAFSPGGGAAARARALMTAQAGRATGYVLAGAAAGGAGASLVGSLDHGGALLALRLASAAMLVWIGLSTLGLVRSFSIADRTFAPILAAVRAPGSSSARIGATAPFVAGLGWSLTPCALVLGAVVYAGLAGSATAGAVVMAGFALGTMPAVVGSAYGVARLRNLGRRPRLRTVVGALLVAIGVGSAAAPGLSSAVFCVP